MFNFKQIISSIADAGEKLFKRKVVKKNDLETILTLCDDLISNKGAAFGIAVARDITELYLTLTDENKLLFFKNLKTISEVTINVRNIYQVASTILAVKTK